jgi:hypothetical protein
LFRSFFFRWRSLRHLLVERDPLPTLEHWRRPGAALIGVAGVLAWRVRLARHILTVP